MRVTFLLPGPGAHAVGGYRVVYQHAGWLARRGHDVTVLHALVHAPFDGARPPLGRRMVRARRWALHRAGLRAWRPDAWFAVDDAVRLRFALDLAPHRVPDGDVVVATAWETAELALALPGRAGARVYLVQHDERGFDGADPGRVEGGWRGPWHAVVAVSRWIADELAGAGVEASIVRNGLDVERWGVDRDPADREPGRVAMLYHRAAWKGTADGLAALERARHELPGLRPLLFGVEPRPAELPAWCDYVHSPDPVSLRALYNEAATVLAPSRREGWGLVGCEGALCGAAPCLTDIGGHREYGEHERTALLVPPGDVPAMAAAIVRIATDDALRLGIAARARMHVGTFTAGRAGAAFEAVLELAARRGAPARGIPPLTREPVG